MKIESSVASWSPAPLSAARPAAREPGDAVGHRLAQATSPEAQVDGEAFAARVRDAVEAINDALAAQRRELRFTVHEGTGKTVVKVIAPDSGEVVRQMPSAEALRLAERLRAGEAPGSLGVDGHS